MRKNVGKKVEDEFERHGRDLSREKTSWCITADWVGR